VGITLWLLIDAIKEAWATVTGLLQPSSWLTVAVLAVIAALNIVAGLRSRSEG
jgi:hypothetical protein